MNINNKYVHHLANGQHDEFYNNNNQKHSLVVPLAGLDLSQHSHGILSYLDMF